MQIKTGKNKVADKWINPGIRLVGCRDRQAAGGRSFLHLFTAHRRRRRRRSYSRPVPPQIHIKQVSSAADLPRTAN